MSITILLQFIGKGPINIIMEVDYVIWRDLFVQIELRMHIASLGVL